MLVPNEAGKTTSIEWDNNLIKYKELLVTTFDSKEAAQPILDELKMLDVYYYTSLVFTSKTIKQLL